MFITLNLDLIADDLMDSLDPNIKNPSGHKLSINRFNTLS